MDIGPERKPFIGEPAEDPLAVPGKETPEPREEPAVEPLEEPVPAGAVRGRARPRSPTLRSVRAGPTETHPDAGRPGVRHSPLSDHR